MTGPGVGPGASPGLVGRLSRALDVHRKHVVDRWVELQLELGGLRAGGVHPEDVREECAALIDELVAATATGGDADLAAPAFDGLRALLVRLSRRRAEQGLSPSETAASVFSLKEALLPLLQEEAGDDPAALFAAVVGASGLVDAMGLVTFESYVKAREAVITRQAQQLVELSTPVVRLWDGILAVPLIGTLDSMRTQVVMESLLEAIVDAGASVAIIDITGVPTVDTQVAQHLLKTVFAARLMGAECVISGIRPAIAQTIVHLGIDLEGVTTRATLGDALALALRQAGYQVLKPGEG